MYFRTKFLRVEMLSKCLWQRVEDNIEIEVDIALRVILKSTLRLTLH